MTEQNILDLPVEAIEDRQHQLISTRRVEGTSVYNVQGEKLGTVHSVMLEKRSGRAAYAVMSFGGFLGIGEIAHPLPWEMLTYDEERDGYVVDVSREQLDKAPAFRLDESDRPRERTQEARSTATTGSHPGGRFNVAPKGVRSAEIEEALIRPDT